MDHLPIDDALGDLCTALSVSNSVVLSAPPGAGKTTRVPIALLNEPWMSRKKLIMLEPRRLAARRAAAYIAALLGEPLGSTVGYRIRGESRISPSTRIEVVTEGILTRVLHEQPDLPGVGLVIFDEFHERSIHADLGLALSLDVQQHLRQDLKLLVMSATLDDIAVAELLGGAPVVRSEGRSHPVQTLYLQFPVEGPIERAVVEAIQRAMHRDEYGDILVFLPGQGEIQRVEEQLRDRQLGNVVVCTLYGEASEKVQQRVFVPPPPGNRKIILSTSIAETSLTIDGVRVVIDAGLVRGPRFDPRRGMSGLTTTRVSKATADQRRGRAGRQQPGTCYRLWTEKEHDQLSPYPTPEITVADLTPLALDVARWGKASLRFLQSPPAAHLSHANELLRNLGALDGANKLTPHGRAMNGLPVHPRLAHMLLRAREIGLAHLACDIAALLEERDILRGGRTGDVDLASRLDALHTGSGADVAIRSRVLAESRRLQDMLGEGIRESQHDDSPGLLLALAYPDRIGRIREEGERRYLLANGTGAALPAHSRLNRHEFLAIGDVDGVGKEVKIFLAAALGRTSLIETFADSMTTKDEVYWNKSEESVVARRTIMLGSLIVEEVPRSADSGRILNAMLDGVRQMGLASLPWDSHAGSMRTRSEWLRQTRIVPDGWPDLSDDHLLATLNNWLAPFATGMSRREHLSRLDMTSVLKSLFTYEQRAALDRLAPVSLTVPTGSRIRLDYAVDRPPVLAVKLQEMFGQIETPKVGGGNIPVVIHLLSPAGRPLAVTQDLRNFWLHVYQDVRKEMRGRYPKHPWPENPISAVPTRKTERKK